jgi:hypothetical protein
MRWIAWALIALGLTGCPAAVDVPACFTARDCAEGMQCSAGECVGALDADMTRDARVDMQPDMPVLDMGPDMPALDMTRDMADMAPVPDMMPDQPDMDIPPDDTLAPGLDQAPACADGCECGEPMRLALGGDARVDIAYLSASDTFWLAVSHASDGQVEHGVWAPGCALDVVDQGPGQRVPMPPAITGDSDSAGLVWRQGADVRFARRRSAAACSFEGATHDLFDGAVDGVGLAVDAGVFHVAASPGDRLQLRWHDGQAGGSTPTEVEATTPALVRSQFRDAAEPWWTIWAREDGRLFAQGFDTERAVATSAARPPEAWRDARLAPLSDREFYVTGLRTNDEGMFLGGLRLSGGGFFTVDPLRVRMGQAATALDMARQAGAVFGVVVDYRRADREQIAFVHLDDGDVRSFPIAHGRHGAVAFGGDRFGVAWVEPGEGVAFRTVRCQ